MGRHNEINKLNKKSRNPYLNSEYDFLDTLEHDGWRWEFLRRLETFRADYELVRGKNIHQYELYWWDLGEKYSMTKEARQNFCCLDPSQIYPVLPGNLKPVFEQTMPIKSVNREKLLKQIRKNQKYLSYIEKDHPLQQLPPEELILLAVEMSIRPGMIPRNVEYMGINMDASHTDLRTAFDAFLKEKIREKTGKGDEKMYLGAHKTAIIVWDLRALRKTFPEIHDITGIDKDTAKKKFYRAYELIYGKKYEVTDYKRPPIREKYLKRHCNTCEQKSTCRVLCPEVIGFVDQDTKLYQREATFSDMHLLTKRVHGPQEEDQDSVAE